MPIFKKKIKLLTHNSSFHADDIFAAACLLIYFNNYKKQKTEIIRSRDPEIIKTGDVVFDVGMKYDPDKNLFDHHQSEGAGVRGEFNIPYSSFGLIWKHFGLELVENRQIHQIIDEKFVQHICADDTASVDFSIPTTGWKIWTLDRIFKLFYPENIDDQQASDKAFLECVDVAKKILEKVIKKETQKFEDTKFILQKYSELKDKRIMILDKFRFWSDAVKETPELLYIIFPDLNKEVYRIRAVPDPENEINSKKALPEPWRGFWRDELAEITKLPKANFVHNSGFLGAANDLDTAIKMAQISADWPDNK
jgi:uncharacterized UPF0160 family protein